MKIATGIVIMLLLGGFAGVFLANNSTGASMSQVIAQKAAQNTPADTKDMFNANYPAPELTGITAWLNLPDEIQGLDMPISIAGLKGKVILVDFWTNQCINCIHTLPYVTRWYDTYKNKGFVVIGVHTPELAYEYTVSSIQTAILTYGIHYPIVQDNNYQTWNAFKNQYWPAEYLIDKKGNVRRTFFGEGGYDTTELAIQTLLKE